MFGFGEGEIIVVLLLLAFPFALYRVFSRTTWIERLVARVAVRRFAALPYLQPGAGGHRQHRLIQFPATLAALVVIAAGLTMAAAAGMLTSRVDDELRVSVLVDTVMSCAGILLAVAMIVVHWASSQVRWRQLKYELAASCWGMLLMGGVLQASAQVQALDAKPDVPRFGSTTLAIEGRTAVSLLIVPLFFLLLGALTHLVTRRMYSREAGYAHTVRLYRWIAPIGRIAVLLFIFQQLPLLAILSIPAYAIASGVTLVLLLAYIFMRFEVKRSLWAYPILYLRSFHDDAARSAFARIVAPVASRHGVLIGLVHQTQPAHVLQRQVSTLDRGGFVEASDDEWRDWVKRALAVAHFVVIDVSHMTGSVEWELNTALDVVGHRRTLLIECREPAGELQDRGPYRLSYSINRSQHRTVRSALGRWFSQATQA